MSDPPGRGLLSRRDLLRWTGLLALGRFLVGCGVRPGSQPQDPTSLPLSAAADKDLPARTPTAPAFPTTDSTSTPTRTPVPSSSPTPSATPTPTATQTPRPTPSGTPTASPTPTEAATPEPLVAISLVHGPSRALILDHVLQRFGIRSTTIRVDRGEAVPDLTSYDAVLFAGGEYRPEEFEEPIFQAERQRILAALEAGIPILGICLGNQLLAYWLGGEVKQARWEFGWLPVSVNEAGQQDPLLAGLGKTFHAFLWHGDQITRLPEEAVVLASTERCPVQVFRLADRPVWGVQFNPQYDPVIAEGVIRASTFLPQHGYDLDEMVATGYREYDDLAGKLFGNFFRHVMERKVARETSGVLGVAHAPDHGLHPG
jgi:GMP synthase (glutamine-hydrolysing)